VLDLLRAYHKRLGRQQRFMLACVVTVLVVAAVVVRWVSAVLDGLGMYGPGQYDPKDFAREQRVRSIVDPSSWSTEALVKAGLFVLLALVWFISVSDGRPGGRWR
jgi:hypothetical protein